VTFIARCEHLRALREHGLQVESVKGDLGIQPARATDDLEEVGEVDVVVVGVKAWQVPEVA
jgi:2-dehydropantoate 2-reductase